MNAYEVTLQAGRRRPRTTRHLGRFARHLGEMTLAMVVGMAALSGPLETALTALSAGALTAVEVTALSMAVAMAIPMAALMRYRHHGWTATAEMCIAMVVPAALLVTILRLGAISGQAVLSVQHMTMLPVMVLAMLHRRHEYSG